MIIFSTIVTIVISISPVITVFDNDPKMGNSWRDQNLSFWIKKTVELHMKTLKPFPINFFHDHTWFGPKISEMKILKFHDYNELWGLMCKSKTARNIYNWYDSSQIWIVWEVRDVIPRTTSYWTSSNSFPILRSKDWCSCNI